MMLPTSFLESILFRSDIVKFISGVAIQRILSYNKHSHLNVGIQRCAPLSNGLLHSVQYIHDVCYADAV
jgi:hypothetical protein